MSCRHVPDRPDIISQLLSLFKNKAYVDYSAISSNSTEKNEPTQEADWRERDNTATQAQPLLPESDDQFSKEVLQPGIQKGD